MPIETIDNPEPSEEDVPEEVVPEEDATPEEEIDIASRKDESPSQPTILAPGSHDILEEPDYPEETTDESSDNAS